MKKILVTGSLGFIGSALTTKLLARGDTVVGVDNAKLSNLTAHQRMTTHSFLCHPHYAHYEADICDSEKILEIFRAEKPCAAAHLAGKTGIKASLSDPDNFFYVNVLGTQSVFNACCRAGCGNVLFGSSVVVYGNSPKPVDEGMLLPPPSNPYAASKLFCERIAKAYSELYGLNISVLRIFSIYGPGQRVGTAVHDFAHAIDLQKPLTLYGDGTSRRDFLYLDCCADGIIAALDRIGRFDIFNLGAQSSVSLKELIALLSACLQKEAIVERIPTPQGIPDATFANMEKTGHILGFVPRIPMGEGISRYIAWYKDVCRNG